MKKLKLRHIVLTPFIYIHRLTYRNGDPKTTTVPVSTKPVGFQNLFGPLGKQLPAMGNESTLEGKGSGPLPD